MVTERPLSQRWEGLRRWDEGTRTREIWGEPSWELGAGGGSRPGSIYDYDLLLPSSKWIISYGINSAPRYIAVRLGFGEVKG
jgi:hypothetical protein